MQYPSNPRTAFVSGLALAAVAFFGLGLAQKDNTKPMKWEYSIQGDVNEKALEKLAADGWEYVGYLGQGMRSSDNDETLWRRPGK
jgi:hypothetical protein